MPEIRFYHLERTALDAALPNLLERCLERDWHAVVLAGSPERVEALNGQLWTYNDRAFLPHGSEKDGYAEHQPVWLTARDENPNGAKVLFLLDGMTSENLGLFELVCTLFDGRDSMAVESARQSWRAYREDGFDVTYWRQTESGWEQQA